LGRDEDEYGAVMRMSIGDDDDDVSSNIFFSVSFYGMSMMLHM